VKLVSSVPQDAFHEVDHAVVDASLRTLGTLIGGQVDRLLSLVHYADVVPEGEQWTIPFTLDCGFDGEIVIRVRASGDCERTSPFEEAAALVKGMSRGV
jgi:hypothetical protein